MVSVACIGECMIELSGGAGGNWKLGFAGDTFNTLWAMRALLDTSANTDYVTAFGDDPFSAQQIAFLKDHGIGTASSPVLAGARPGLYAITLTGAERSFTYWRSDAAARQLASRPDDLAKSLHNQTLIYFSGISLAILDERARNTLFDALTQARLAGSRIAFDPNYRPRLWSDADIAKEVISRALAITDIALPTFPDEQALYGDVSPEETAARLTQADIPEIVVKNGELPCLVTHYGKSESISAVSVNAVDTTGAGDSFNGSYLAARLHGCDPIEAARRAHNVAAQVVQVRGALAPFEILRSAFNA